MFPVTLSRVSPGARVRALVVDPSVAEHETYDVLIVGARWPALSAGFVAALHASGRRVLGVSNAGDEGSREFLVRCGVDRVVDGDAAPQTIVEAARGVARALEVASVAPTADAIEPTARVVPPAPRGRVIVVGGPSGGGSTEVALELARSIGAVIVDADEVAPSVAPRLGIPTEPNLRTLVESVEFAERDPLAAVQRAGADHVGVVCGVTNVVGRSPLRASEVVRAVRLLARVGTVVVDTSAPLDDIGPTNRGRYAVTRALHADADMILAVGLATPLGAIRTLGWLASLQALRADVSVDLVVNRSVGATRARLLASEIVAAHRPNSVWCVPEDRRVGAAAWSGGFVRRGPFTRAVESIGMHVAKSPVGTASARAEMEPV